MKLYLFRHGIAEDPAPGRPDRSRSLTPEGVRRLKLQAQTLKRAGFRVDRLFCSPYDRARETATLLASAFDVGIEPDSLLAPGCTLDDLAELVSRLDGVEHLMVVGHQPDLGQHVRHLTGGNVRFRTGTLAVVEMQGVYPGAGTLDGLYDADVMVHLAPAGPSRH